ncbi:K(lysine) acetyltransferase [Mortierella alpina]|uniref:histone acetyltransferase n=1 Tax=Mortierella alpina TaxID=64518 RepID=A0A9P6IWP8_MORAP|nr:K(lysine) acetyltransferase [Mortierella alpina]
MTTRKDKDAAIEIGGLYAIIGKDGREYRVEVLGKRVTDMDTDVYIHYKGTDKRLDEWVDIQRLMALKIPTAGETSTSAGSSSEPGRDDSMQDTALTAENRRPKRRAIRGDVTDSPIAPSLKATDVVQEGAVVHPRGNARQDYHDEEAPQVRNVEWILYAGYDIATWYYSPFPEEYEDCQRLFICEYCLKYIRQVENFMNHTKSCRRKKPPGTVVYSKGANKIYKVDGGINKLYCQNLSLLAKLFLDNKTLYFDVHGFQFFVLTETRSGDRADVPVGFFSKEIVSYDGYNLACILILPPFQRKSYGKMLIEFSYELTKIEGKVGSPEKPLSDLGKLGYVSYWITAILRELYPKPWPAKRIILPLSNRRKSRAASIKATSTSETVVEASTSAAMERVLPLPDIKTESIGQGPMDIDPASMSEPVADTAKDSSSSNHEIAFSIRELAARTGIMEEDLLETLVTMGWMTRWQSPRDQLASSAIKQAKRNYRKLMKFHEQQQLLEKYGGGHDLGSSTGHLDGHEHESGSGHLHSQARPHSRQSSGAHVSVNSASAGLGGRHAGASRSQSPQIQMQASQPGLTEGCDPVAILEMPESEDDYEDDGSLLESTQLEAGAGLKDVAVVTMAMVKEYQDRHNIRLDPYLDWNAIDWAAYHSTLDL